MAPRIPDDDHAIGVPAVQVRNCVGESHRGEARGGRDELECRTSVVGIHLGKSPRRSAVLTVSTSP